MATFDLGEFIKQPNLEALETCRKDDLFIIAQHFEICVSKTMLKKELKACLVAGLLEKGALPLDVEETSEALSAGQDEPCESHDAVVDAVTPLPDLSEVGPFSLPKFEPLSLSTDESISRVDARVKLRIARLQLEWQDKAQARKDELEHRLELYRIDAETKIKLRQLELQGEEIAKEKLSPIKVDSEMSVESGPTAVENVNDPVVSNSSVLVDSSNVCASPSFNVAKNIVIVPSFSEREVEAYFQAFEKIATALRWPLDVWALMLQCKLTGKAQEVCAALPLEESSNYETVKNAILRAYELVPEHYRQRFRTTKKAASQTHVEFVREKALLFDRWVKACKVQDYVSLRELVLIEEFKNCIPERTAIYLNEQKVTSVQQAAVLADEYALLHKSAFVKRPLESVSVKENSVSTCDRSDQNPSGFKFRKECSYCHKTGHGISECRVLKRKQGRSDSSPAPVQGSLLVASPPAAPEVMDECFKPFVFDGYVSLTGRVEDQHAVKILRDTGGSQSFILADALPFDATSACDTSTIVQGIEMGFVPVPLHRVWVSSDLVSGYFNVAIRASLPVQGIHLIMGNDIAGGKVMPVMHVTDTPVSERQPDELAESFPSVFAVSAVTTRAQVKRLKGNDVNLGESVFAEIFKKDAFPQSLEAPNLLKAVRPNPEVFLPVSCEVLTEAQKNDSTLAKCRLSADGNLSPSNQFYWNNTVLMRRWSPRPWSDEVQDDWSVVHQIVVPSQFRQQILNLAHDHPWSGHLGVNKTYNRVLQHFFWPGLKADVSRHCKVCHTCQVMGKPNQIVPPAPLHPIPANHLSECLLTVLDHFHARKLVVSIFSRLCAPQRDFRRQYRCEILLLDP